MNEELDIKKLELDIKQFDIDSNNRIRTILGLLQSSCKTLDSLFLKPSSPSTSKI